ncbi:SDR family NAD(P)-dependent oxidoreductase [Mycobacterium sp. 1245801.1]|uniref:SDR family NAD(P)-dependent oxidoreductase n=1 Tax=Mycobacterium sp. 1245801.1 TaxID=1834075 RepID=UPI000801E35A|nr:SDR family NAD(P)-dependent oxidoreductase [Mycobacterium sp. 1245801.1]OBJ23652.1 short-chain dehydrogenase [Mycobacterium sp. 1245801.1]
MRTKWTVVDIPDQSGRVAVITGANTGIGFHTAVALAGKGADVVLAVRHPDKGKDAAARITAQHPNASVAIQHLDLTSLRAIRKSAEQIKSVHQRIDLLINNAGVCYTDKARTQDGYELQLGTNHLGHFALTGLLLDRLLQTDGSRVVTVSSVGHRTLAKINFDDLQSERAYNRVKAYGQSKLANLLFTYELQRRLARNGTATVALAAHPGGSKTELLRNMPAWIRPPAQIVWNVWAQSAEMGALPTLRAATDSAAQGGQYYGPDRILENHGHPKVVRSSKQSHNQALQSRLWAVSEELTGVTFPV